MSVLISDMFLIQGCPFKMVFNGNASTKPYFLMVQGSYCILQTLQCLLILNLTRKVVQQLLESVRQCSGGRGGTERLLTNERLHKPSLASRLSQTQVQGKQIGAHT